MQHDGNSLSIGFLESLYADYIEDPASVPADWHGPFAAIARADGNAAPVRRGLARRRAVGISSGRAPGPADENGAPTAMDARGASPRPFAPAGHQHRVAEIIRDLRARGHLAAKLDPLGRARDASSGLGPEDYGFSDEDLDQPVASASIAGPNAQSLRQLIDHLRRTYCRSIGVQFMHIDDATVRLWLQERMERSENRTELPPEQKLRILRRLTEAVTFEQFIQKAYVGAKSFSLEGAETLIPLIDMLIDRADEQDVKEIVIGMAHRGRLNVLSNVLGKPAQDIFREFEDEDPLLYRGGGDLKHHLGYSAQWTTSRQHELHLSLCFNPSHLEFIGPVALGRTRAKQDRWGDGGRTQGLALLIHGDAGFAGEGVVQETLNMSQLSAYTAGGAIHVIVNNQIGFTTAPDQARSSVYATDVAKLLQIPIFHVNGEDPDAVAAVVRLAMDFRHRFARDVVIDMYCYRRYGHNEADEPAFTQPTMYRAIEAHAGVRAAYLERLLDLGGVTREEADQYGQDLSKRLEKALSAARNKTRGRRRPALSGVWSGYRGGPDADVGEVETGVPKKQLAKLLATLAQVPAGFHAHKKIERGLERRRRMAEGERPLDWSAGEALAFATLAAEGWRVRLSGQDSERGTFSHRHAVLHDVDDGGAYVPLEHVADDQAPVEIHNSPLSEAGVLAFEYGYSLDSPDALVVWEAQFGDFANAAQVIIDQFITSAEDKWNRLTGLVLLLPHGFEGQGPEHSSGRVERWLMLAAEDNLQLVYPTTPAQYFHCLRRQVLRPWRKPLVVMTPKSLLRHRDAVSTLDDCAAGTFLRVIEDGDHPADVGREVERVLLCSGKIYYELRRKRGDLDRGDVAIVRVEQLYPFPQEALRSALAGYADGTPVFWVQEEPRNMGAWPFMQLNVGGALFDRLPLTGVYRPESASPATGSAAAHKLEQEELVSEAFGGGDRCRR